jgi:hypothetical protein
MINTLFLLLCGHALADFVLQTDIMAKLKNRHNKPDNIPNGQKYIPCWGYWLTAHSLIHGGIVYLITGNIMFGLIETASHWLIDFLKCENVTNPNQDQFFHIFLKIVYCLPFK